MKPSFKYWIFLGAIYFALISIIVASLIGAWVSINEPQQIALGEMLNKLIPFPLLGTITILFIIGALINLLFNDYIIPILKLAESARLISSVNPQHRIKLKNASKEIQYLAEIINQSADAFVELKVDVAGKIAVAQAALDEERTRLAALMSELPHGVIVCNTDGQILLYNQQAQELFRDNLNTPADNQTQGILGLGRSIFGILDRDPIVHGLEMLHKCHASGRTKMVNNSMMTLHSGLCLRVNMAPFFTEQENAKIISGFVLTLEDMTYQIESDNRRDLLIQSLIDEQQKELKNICDSTANIRKNPGLDPKELKSYRDKIDQASQALQIKLSEARESYALHLHALNKIENVMADSLLEVISNNISKRFSIDVTTLAPKGIWLQLDSYSLVQAISHLAGLLNTHANTSKLLMTLTTNKDHSTELVIAWTETAASQTLIETWQTTPLLTDTKGNLLTLKDTIENLSGSISSLSGATGETTGGILVVFPPIDQNRRLAMQCEVEHRPVSYEFDLFNRGEWKELGQTPLKKLTFVVFDTETTGLNPSKGDEIIQLGAIRIVNGQLLYHEVIDQLVDPKRSVPPESVVIHGIQPALLKGQPTIDKVLPHFHTFAESSVLVAHNAAFDMRFLQLQEEKTGIFFDNPVLDTLLLSSVIHPNQDSHSLDGLAERLNVTIVGRHTALGDAIVTGEVLVKMIPLLEAHGIHTLADALTAAAESPFAKTAY